MDNLWLRVENIVAKGEILRNFFFCHYVFIKPSSAEVLESIYIRERVKPFPVTDSVWRLCSRWILKTIWQKEKLLIISIFSFCHNMFNSILKLNIFIKRFPIFFSRWFKSHLLLVCFMWERVKPYSVGTRFVSMKQLFLVATIEGKVW